MNLNLDDTIIDDILKLKFINSPLTDRVIVEENLLDFYKKCSRSLDKNFHDYYKYLNQKTKNAVLGNRLDDLIKLIWANPVKITESHVYTADGFKWSRIRSKFIFYKVKKGIRTYNKNPDGSIDQFNEEKKYWIFDF